MLEPGQTVLHYELIEELGEGGMGAVWLARDTTLDRAAAIKVLPGRLAEDEQFRARFDREAKLLASLDHPNLATVFGIHKFADAHFIAMEYVPGEDLSTRLERGPLPVDEAIAVCEQVASVLESAHEGGVIHRDLKPANVRITPDGRVKVLDFGLAKAVAAGTEDVDVSLTASGVLLGTVPYMSPEQARGEAVDGRTDIWSFGCLLFECLTGKHPFPASTVSDQIAAILTKEPDWSLLPPDLPGPVRVILRQSLQKPVDQRLSHVSGARVGLETAALDPPPRKPDRSRLPVPLSAILVIGMMGLLAWIFTQGGTQPPRGSVLEGYTTTRFTNFPGEEIDAAISPNGEFVAFLADRRVTNHGAEELDGIFHVFRGQISTHTFDQVSKASGEAGIDAPMLTVRRLGFLGDEMGLWVSGIFRHLRRVSFVGSKETDWLERGMIHVDWSPDGKQIVFSHMLNGDPVYVTEASSAPIPTPEKPILGSEEGYHQHFPTWSRDGKWIYLIRGIVAFGEMDLWRVRPDGSDPHQLSRDLRNVAYPVPMDKRTVLFVAETADGSGPWLWEFDVPSRTAKRVQTGADRYLSLSASRDLSRLVATVSNPTASLFTIPLRKLEAEGKATEAEVKPYPLPAVRALCPRFRGDVLYFLSSRGAGDGLWRHERGASQPQEIWSPRQGPILEPPAISPDGTHVALVARTPKPELYVINANGKTRTRIMADVEVLGAPAWSHDSEAVYCGGRRNGEPGLFRATREDGWKAALLVRAQATNPVCSSDGELILFVGRHVATGQRLFAATPDGTQKKDFPPIWTRPFGERVRFLPDGSGFVYMRGVDPTQEFRYFDLKTGKDIEISALEDSSVMRTFDITPDGKSIVFGRQRANADIVLIQRED